MAAYPYRVRGRTNDIDIVHRGCSDGVLLMKELTIFSAVPAGAITIGGAKGKYGIAYKTIQGWGSRGLLLPVGILRDPNVGGKDKILYRDSEIKEIIDNPGPRGKPKKKYGPLKQRNQLRTRALKLVGMIGRKETANVLAIPKGTIDNWIAKAKHQQQQPPMEPNTKKQSRMAQASNLPDIGVLSVPLGPDPKPAPPDNHNTDQATTPVSESLTEVKHGIESLSNDLLEAASDLLDHLPQIDKLAEIEQTVINALVHSKSLIDAKDQRIKGLQGALERATAEMVKRSSAMVVHSDK